MKKIGLIAFACLMIFSFKNEAIETITLQEALDRNIVKISAKGTGGYSGHTVDLTVESKFSGIYNIKIDAGQVFRANDPTVQDQLIPDEIVMQVRGRSTKTYPITGFCCEYSNSAPDENTTFSYEKMNRPNLLALCELTNKKNYDRRTLQNAIWAVSDNYDVGTIYSDTDTRVQTLRKEICKLTNQPDTWYHKKETISVAEDRSIVSRAESLRSDIRVDLIKGTRKFSYKVYNVENELQSDRQMTMTVPMTSMYTFKFKLEVYGWQEGTYKVDMFIDADKIHNYEFTI